MIKKIRRYVLGLFYLAMVIVAIALILGALKWLIGS